jgi:hypothetical protein
MSPSGRACPDVCSMMEGDIVASATPIGRACTDVRSMMEGGMASSETQVV